MNSQSPQLSEVSASRINYRLPQVEQLLQLAILAPFISQLSRPVVTDIIRTELASIRQSEAFKTKGAQHIDINLRIVQRCERVSLQRQHRVINATGIALHTNLGRSPLHREVWDAISDVNTGYTNLEITLENGKRGGRNGLLTTLVRSWLGTENVLLVNNNAASMYLVLLELAKGKEVIVSRGEQIQIGGGFRIPDILALSGCKLVEVGTTNVTTADDYINAITEDTAMVLMVHQSNFFIGGFTESPDIREVKRRLPSHVNLVIDQGSGMSTERFSSDETQLATYLDMGADLVCFSGDKILGGPQAGLIAGCDELIQRLGRNPMMRAFRCGRIILSLMEELLVRKLNQETSGQGIAERTLANLPQARQWCETLAQRWHHRVTFVQLPTQVGGGAMPAQTYSGCGLVLNTPLKPQALLDHLRLGTPAIFGYLHNNQVVLNLTTVLEADQAAFVERLDSFFQQLDRGEHA
ncbi:L-seryl-tRNA(Sec) selenium transferase [Vibrio sp. V27_P1S3P104]|uniref:L-seryl-tRNA(Sec) selenium transferase n=1 Tax=unclassified Vibrio TaxID=2614977 RepID=UPI0013729DA6|nr:MULTISPECIES: L-seryl-tRNA(Sec) selenium transferase [unclassified Vibrio]NAW67993.1 L-seryl-tRNA(Sec) selenium transferase [Vibrio sp. V28_P6S34P95]NAX04452.1 L-seryl-tRNA(Sec) selenium transferase [Vibrio sp. V30_P3S12P165]NAX35809.1 L-seryl-tRNA(Sec) selenium transferase [Vibrio sp. V29_P1S30P107]NAX37377.1 L-seryl-tRNA(Sec) selenium transferase [Vibrio sp. V27_P1S3P104]NAX41786.1 L-seryl-tRNA(Sec) selenium transferase [Vibrio sp. V26_P1S5P106]